MQTPRNIHYETKKRRYTVRLWFKNDVIYRSHHADLNTAINALDAARANVEQYRERMRRRTSSRPVPALPNNLMDLL
jgi:hypothetical protein